MNRTLLALLVSFGALAQAPVIDSITPAEGPDSGGTAVVIRGTNLHLNAVCVLPCPPQVAFGDVVVDAVEISDRELNVTTPAHPAGVVDVTVAVTGREPVVVEDGFTFLGGPERNYERVLLPIYFKGAVPGAYSAQWATDLWIHNGGIEPVWIADRACPPPVVCPPVFPLAYPLLPGASLHNPEEFFQTGRSNPSLILYLSDQGAKDTSFGLRVGDTSRNDVNGGTDLPVIRENELLTRTAQFLNVPLNNRDYRILLRVYDTVYGEARFGVYFRSAEPLPSAPVYSTTLTATTPKGPPFRAEAAYAELDITHLLDLRLAWPETARIEVRPMTPGSRYWTVVSLTNNETQLVTLVTPQ